MNPWSRLKAQAARLMRGPLPTFYDPAYRIPIASLEQRAGMALRRADFAAWTLADLGLLRENDLRTPRRVSWGELALVHSGRLLESLTQPETLAQIFAVRVEELDPDEVLHTLRLAVGATVDATREALRRRGPTLNLLGGFHHAGPDSAGGFCAVNDLAVAIAVARGEGFDGTVLILDLDAHPPDGTALCVAADPKVRLASLSGSDWGALPEGVDEVRLPEGCRDPDYLSALDALLKRNPPGDLNLIVAGCDVLAGDRFGRLGLTLTGARRRDLRVARALKGRASVWVPSGGYHDDSWRVLVGTALVLAMDSADDPLPADYEPLRARFSRIFAEVAPHKLGAAEEPWFSAEDLEMSLGQRGHKDKRLLGFYTAAGLEFACYQYGLFDQMRRLGYTNLRVTVDEAAGGDRARTLGSADGKEHMLVEMVLERHRLHDEELLFVNWLTLRHPRAAFTAERPQLPGQDAPGLGLAPEFTQILALMARRLRLKGVIFRPSHYHVAYACRRRFRFTDPARQGRFEALNRDLGGHRLLDVTRAVSAGQVTLNGEPYVWEPDDMVMWLDREPQEDPAAERERQRSRFEWRSDG